MNERLRHLAAMGCEVNYYRGDDGWRIEIASGRRYEHAADNDHEPTYWIVTVSEMPTRESAETEVLRRFDELGFFPTPLKGYELPRRDSGLVG